MMLGGQAWTGRTCDEGPERDDSEASVEWREGGQAPKRAKGNDTTDELTEVLAGADPTCIRPRTTYRPITVGEVCGPYVDAQANFFEVKPVPNENRVRICTGVASKAISEASLGGRFNNELIWDTAHGFFLAVLSDIEPSDAMIQWDSGDPDLPHVLLERTPRPMQRHSCRCLPMLSCYSFWYFEAASWYSSRSCVSC